MSHRKDSQRELPSTYFIQDRSMKEELKRVQIQGHMLTTAMGGALPEQPAPERFQRVLDVGCGTGEWLIEAAKTYPRMSLLIGVDISNTILNYARAQAVAQGVHDRVKFRQMDVLRGLEFPPDSFDLINQRMAVSYLRTWEWPHLMQEYQRVGSPGSVFRITEPSNRIESGSPTLTRLWALFQEAFYRAGHLFTPPSEKVDVAKGLAYMRYLSYRVQQVQTHVYPLTYRAGTPEGQCFFEDMQYFFRTIVPFLHKWIYLPDDYQESYQQMLYEMQRPDFIATWEMNTAWG